jgi:fructuronate reductase
LTPRITQALSAQDGLYTVLEHGPEQTRCTIVGTLCSLVYSPANPLALRQALADPAVRIVTLTVTTAGYFADPATGHLDAAHPLVQQDLRREFPTTAIGVLVAGLAQRRANGGAPPVVLCCDNLPSNGHLLRQMCMDFAALQDDGLAAWIAGKVQFPSTMVDRIVPVTTDEDRRRARHALGLIDAAPVSAEPFSQWVIENFDGPRPRWDQVGAQYVPDVGPWEASKLRLLNGGHLAIACLGLLAGCESVAEAMAVPGFSAYALQFMVEEQKPTLPPSDHDISAYALQLLARWRSRGIVHRLDRVARDASTKLASRLLASLRENMHAGRPTPCTVLAVAAWMRCLTGTDDAGHPIVLSDPLHGQFDGATAAAAGPAALVDAALGLKEVFGEDLPHDIGLRRALTQAVSVLQQSGARGAVMACVAGTLFREDR